MKRRALTAVMIAATVLAFVGAPMVAAQSNDESDTNVNPISLADGNHVTFDTDVDTSADWDVSGSSSAAQQLNSSLKSMEGLTSWYQDLFNNSVTRSGGAHQIATDLFRLEHIEATSRNLSSDVRSSYHLSSSRFESIRTDLRNVGDESFQSDVDEHLEKLRASSPEATEPLTESGVFETLTTLGGVSVPGPAGNERFDVHIQKANGETLRFAITTSGGSVEAIEVGSHENPTVTVYADHSVVRDLRAGDESVQTIISDAMSENRLTYDANGIFNSAIYGALSTVAG